MRRRVRRNSDNSGGPSATTPTISYCRHAQVPRKPYAVVPWGWDQSDMARHHACTAERTSENNGHSGSVGRTAGVTGGPDRAAPGDPVTAAPTPVLTILDL